MSENEEEPSIEEILSSIRQIISDDDEEEEGTPAPEAKVEEAAEPEPVDEEPAAEEDDVLELTEEMKEEPEPAAEPEPEPEPEEEEIEIDLQEVEPAAEAPVDEAILSDATKDAALTSMAKLAGNMPVSRKPGYDGVTVEDIVHELLRPMLREWMDGNLNEIVEKIVQKEIEKLGRRAADD